MEQCAHLLPPHVITHEHLLITCVVASKTLSNYGARLLRFHCFCDDMCTPEELCMPLPEWLLSTFLTLRGTRSVGKGAKNTWLQGLQLWHTINHMPWLSGSHLKQVIKCCSGLILKPKEKTSLACPLTSTPPLAPSHKHIQC